jgi:hypothetical protein
VENAHDYFFANLTWYHAAVVLLTIIPLLAYPLKYAFPSVRSQGREGERKMAFIMANMGYVIGVIAAQALHAPRVLTFLFATYFVSGFILLLTNRFLNIKASGHACGLLGPIAFLIFLLRGASCYLVLLVPLVFWARLKLERHDMKQLIIGSLTGIIPTIMVFALFTVR